MRQPLCRRFFDPTECLILSGARPLVSNASPLPDDPPCEQLSGPGSNAESSNEIGPLRNSNAPDATAVRQIVPETLADRMLFFHAFESLVVSNEFHEAMTIHRETMMPFFFQILLDCMSSPKYCRTISDICTYQQYVMQSVIGMMDGRLQLFGRRGEPSTRLSLSAVPTPFLSAAKPQPWNPPQ